MSQRRPPLQIGDREAYAMCKRKRKFKSGEANKAAARFNQRKYLCPICGGWHLTKLGRNTNAEG